MSGKVRTRPKLDALGVDFGGVIVDRANDGTDTAFFSDNYLRSTAVPGAFPALARLVAERFGARVYLISKCGPVVEAKTRHWLEHHGFFAATGIDPAQLHFCRERRDKAGICARLAISHFIDDHLGVLQHLSSVEHLYLFAPADAAGSAETLSLGRIRRVRSWPELTSLLLA